MPTWNVDAALFKPAVENTDVVGYEGGTRVEGVTMVTGVPGEALDVNGPDTT